MYPSGYDQDAQDLHDGNHDGEHKGEYQVMDE
jgi:hypothetical protein